MKPATLLGHVALYSVLRRYRLLRDVPSHESQFPPLLLSFGILGNWYVPVGTSGLLTQDGQSLPFHTVYPLTGGVVVGFRDITAADGTPHQDAWRESLHERIMAESGLSAVLPARESLLAG